MIDEEVFLLRFSSVLYSAVQALFAGCYGCSYKHSSS